MRETFTSLVGQSYKQIPNIRIPPDGAEGQRWSEEQGSSRCNSMEYGVDSVHRWSDPRSAQYVKENQIQPDLTRGPRNCVALLLGRLKI